VIEAYKDRLTAIFQENAGQGRHSMLELHNPKVRSFVFWMLDDYFHKDKLAKVVAGFLDHPEWVQISHRWISVNREGLPTNRVLKALSQGDVRNLLLQRKVRLGITSGWPIAG